MIRLEQVSKTFVQKDKQTEALKNVSLTIEDGSIFGIIGSSGAGKSTLVRCLNLLERPTEGKVYIDDTELTALGSANLRTERRKIGMVFQQFNLLAQRNALKNVCYPLEIAGVGARQAKERAKELLKMVGLEDRMYHYPAQLSGGQKQRVAIARAMVNNPKILLADEPTGALDSKSGAQIMELFQKLNDEGVTIVMITHDKNIAAHAKQVYHIIDGEISKDGNEQTDENMEQTDENMEQTKEKEIKTEKVTLEKKTVGEAEAEKETDDQDDTIEEASDEKET